MMPREGEADASYVSGGVQATRDRVGRRGGHPIAQVTRELGIAESELRRWLGQHEVDSGQREGLTTNERKELTELRREVPSSSTPGRGWWSPLHR